MAPNSGRRRCHLRLVCRVGRWAHYSIIPHDQLVADVFDACERSSCSETGVSASLHALADFNPANIMEDTIDAIKQKEAFKKGLDLERIRANLNQMIDQRMQIRPGRNQAAKRRLAFGRAGAGEPQTEFEHARALEGERRGSAWEAGRDYGGSVGFMLTPLTLDYDDDHLPRTLLPSKWKMTGMPSRCSMSGSKGAAG